MNLFAVVVWFSCLSLKENWSRATLGSVLLPILLWTLFRLRDWKTEYYYFDARDRLLDEPSAKELSRSAGTFEPFLGRYTDLAKLVISLAIGSIAILSGYVSYVWQNKPEHLYSVQLALGPSLIMLAFSVMYAILFLIVLSWTYETYVHNYKSYTPSWASLVRSLAFSSTTCFATGYLWLAISIVTTLGR